jgi:uncharacterized membrane protein YdjX (TVP38/TMEM64 family)
MRWAVLLVFLIALVLIPFVLFEEYFNVLAARATRGDTPGWLAAAAIVALLALDVFLPIPSSFVSTAAGALLGFWRGAAVIWIGMMVGCVLGYTLGARASGAARRLVGAEGLDRAANLVSRFGDWAIVLCRPLPVLAEVSVIFFGLLHAPFGRLLWLTAYPNLGIALGYAAFGAFSLRVGSFLLAFVGALAIAALAFASRLMLEKGRG